MTPKKFEKSMCETLVEMGKTGASKKMMLAEIGISYSTAETFAKKHKDFAEAMDLALVHAQAYWEREMLANVNNKAFNSRIAEIALRGQFPKDYREKVETKVDVKAEVKVDFKGAVNELITALKEAK